jgi:hypothetical protein
MAYHVGLNREAARSGEEVAEASVFATSRKPVVVKESGKCKPLMVAIVDTGLEEYKYAHMEWCRWSSTHI